MLRHLLVLAFCSLLAACAGSPKKPVVHDGGLCLSFARQGADRMDMRMCNCGDRVARVQTTSLPWDPAYRSGLKLSFGGKLISQKEYAGFQHETPFSYYAIPVGECMSGTVSLSEAFHVESMDLGSPGWSLVWSAEIFGDGESWNTYVKYDF